jgi:hypothetical protein
MPAPHERGGAARDGGVHRTRGARPRAACPPAEAGHIGHDDGMDQKWVKITAIVLLVAAASWALLLIL